MDIYIYTYIYIYIVWGSKRGVVPKGGLGFAVFRGTGKSRAGHLSWQQPQIMSAALDEVRVGRPAQEMLFTCVTQVKSGRSMIVAPAVVPE